ncbi:MAG: hypothetical protein ACFFBH_13255 [Promethearchaeota archaeon]
MIDDEDEDEKVLKKKISLKSILKNLLMIVLIVVGAVFIYLGGGENQIYNFFIGFTLICLGSTLLQVQRHPSEPVRQTLSILKCNLCGVIKVRNYQYGDFVFKKVDTCNECNEAMEVNQIYSVKLKKSVALKKEDLKKEIIKSEK